MPKGKNPISKAFEPTKPNKPPLRGDNSVWNVHWSCRTSVFSRLTVSSASRTPVSDDKLQPFRIGVRIAADNGLCLRRFQIKLVDGNIADRFILFAHFDSCPTLCLLLRCSRIKTRSKIKETVAGKEKLRDVCGSRKKQVEVFTGLIGYKQNEGLTKRGACVRPV